MFTTQASASRCDTESFPDTLADAAATMIDAGKTSILSDADGCPEAGDRCATKAYLLHGDSVFMAQARGAFRCVAFAGKRTQSTGWLRQDALSPSRISASGDWAGTWTRAHGSATLTIRRKGKTYSADMLATAETANAENVRTGVASGELAISGTRAKIVADGEDGGCHVEIVKAGQVLLVNDGGTEDANSPCDGMGVTLNGVYRKASR